VPDRFLLATLLSASLLAPSVAMAQEPAPAVAAPPPAAAPDPAKPSPPSPEQIAMAKAKAEAVLARTGFGDVFEAIEDGAVPSVRHKASGLTCSIDDSADGGLHLYPGLPRGEDVSCGSTSLGITQTLYATRYPQKPTARQVVESSLQAIAQNFTDLENYTGDAISMKADGVELPQVFVARLTGKLKGKPVFTRSAAFQNGDWVYAQRVTGPVDKATVADLMAEMTLMVLRLKLTGNGLDAPASGQPAS